MGYSGSHAAQGGQSILTAHFGLQAAYFSQIAQGQRPSGPASLVGRYRNGVQRQGDTTLLPEYATDFVFAGRSVFLQQSAFPNHSPQTGQCVGQSPAQDGSGGKTCDAFGFGVEGGDAQSLVRRDYAQGQGIDEGEGKRRSFLYQTPRALITFDEEQGQQADQAQKGQHGPMHVSSTGILPLRREQGSHVVPYKCHQTLSVERTAAVFATRHAAPAHHHVTVQAFGILARRKKLIDLKDRHGFAVFRLEYAYIALDFAHRP